MSCEYCYGLGWHNSCCPNYTPKKPNYYCSICKKGIYHGEEYVENYNDKYAHYDCLTEDLSFYSMIKWLGGEVKTMEEDD